MQAASSRPQAAQTGSASAELTLTGIAHVADAIAHALGLAGDVDESVPTLALPVWAACGLDDAACQRVFAHTEAQFEAICEALLH